MSEPEVEYGRYCLTCRTALEETTHPDGAKTYRHVDTVITDLEAVIGADPSRPRHDHEPAPAPIREFIEAVLRCDFCPVGSTAWYYEVSEPILEVDGTNMGTRWAACEPCAELVEARQPEKLAQRYLRNSPHRKLWSQLQRFETYRQVAHRFEKIFGLLLPGRSKATDGDPFGLKTGSWTEGTST